MTGGDSTVISAGAPPAEIGPLVSLRKLSLARVFLAESRPYERQTAAGMAVLVAAGVPVTLCMDTMLASVFTRHRIQEAWGFYAAEAAGCFLARPGTLMLAILASKFGVPLVLFQSRTEREPVGSFFGVDISVAGAFVNEDHVDEVPASLVSASYPLQGHAAHARS